jgi:ketosteroid isomerase-like protein
VVELGDEGMARIREAYDAFNRGDFEAASVLFHPEIVWHRVAEVEGPFKGADAATDHLRPDVFSSQRNEVHSIEVIGDCVLVDCTFHGEGSTSGIRLDQRGFHLWRMRDGMAIEFRYFLDRDQAVAAAMA